jgi:hypothetical protein
MGKPNLTKLPASASIMSEVYTILAADSLSFRSLAARAVSKLIYGTSALGRWPHPPLGLLDVTIQQEQSRK